MWGAISKRDERYYKRKDAEHIARLERMKKDKDLFQAKSAILSRVKAGEITLAEGQNQISSLSNIEVSRGVRHERS